MPPERAKDRRAAEDSVARRPFARGYFSASWRSSQMDAMFSAS